MCTHGLGDKDTICQAYGHSVNGFVVVRRWGALNFQGRIWLACLSNSAGWQKTASRCWGMSRNGSGPFDKEDYLASEQSWEGTLQLDHSKPSWFYQISRQHIILWLNFRLSTTYCSFHWIGGFLLIEDKFKRGNLSLCNFTFVGSSIVNIQCLMKFFF